MKYLKSVVVMSVVVLGMMAADAMAAGKDPYATKPIESPFKGTVGNISPTSVSVKGEVQLANPDKDAGKSKPTLKNFSFSIKGAKLMRDGKPCELKDVQKGDSAAVTFTSKKDSEKRTVTEIQFSSSGGGAAAAPGEEKPKAEKEPKEKKKK